MTKIQIRRGLKSDLPVLSAGELGFCTDTKELFIGTQEGINSIFGGSSSSGSDSTYIVELSRWGITQGLPTKRPETINGTSVNCYDNADYLKARNNMTGITNAINWASNNGYTTVLFPQGSYSLCHSRVSRYDYDNTIVITASNMTIDFNKSTFKVMYDSAKRSPYHTVTGASGGFVPIDETHPEDIFWLGNMGCFVIRDCSFTTLRNGTLIGDRIDRDFTIQKEKSMEFTTGIAAGGNCKYITIENMDVSFFMGDAISTSVGTNVFVKTGYSMGWTTGTIDNTGAKIASTTYCVSDFIAVSPSTRHFLHGYGTTQGMTALKNKRYTAYMYDTNKNYITSETQFTMRDFTTTKSTAFVRLVVEEPSVDVDGWQMILKTGTYGNFLVYRNNYIHHCHRGGLTPGVNDMFVINNWFYNNGEQYDLENNLPGFEQESGATFLTRYHINMEDSQGFNQNIIGNRFDGGRISIAARGYNFIIRDNTFKDNIIVLYRMHHVSLKSNHFDNAGFTSFSYDTTYNTYEDFIRNWRIEDNIFDGDFSITGTALVTSISNNTFTGLFTLGCDVSSFNGNVFKVDKDFNFQDAVKLQTVTNIEGCTFIKKPQSVANNSIYIEGALLTNCNFKNLKVRVKNVTIKDSTATDSGFEATDGELKFDNCNINQGPGKAEVISLTITNSTGATSDGNVTVTLNGVATTVAVLSTDNTPSLVAAKIRGTTFTGWTTGGTTNNVTFTASKESDGWFATKTDGVYSAGTTGATGSISTTVQGYSAALKNNYAVNPDNSAFINISNNSNPIVVEIKNSNIVSSNPHAIFGSASSAVTNAKLKLDNTKINRQINSRLGIGIFGNVLDFNNSTITSDVTVTAITPNAAYVHRFTDCTLTNVTFNTKATDIKYSQQDLVKTVNFGESGGQLTYKGSLVAGTNANAVDRQTLNLYNKSLIVTGSKHDVNTGNILTNAGYLETHKIPVKPGYNYVFNKGDGISMQYCFVDASDVYITGASNSRAKAPANARGLYVNIPSTTVSDALMVMETTNVFADYVPNTQKYLATQPVQGWYRSKWFEKTWWVLGDSISTGLGDGAGAGNVYANKPYSYLLGRDRSIKIQNESVSGYTINNIYTNKVVNMPGTSDAPDLITIMAGTNDHGFNITIGAITDDPASGTSFYAVYRKTIEYLITQYPNASIGLITPIQRNGTVDGNVNNAVSKKLRDYCDAVVALGKYYSIPVLDWYDNLGFSPYIASQKTNYYCGSPSDGTHPNDLGHLKMAAAVGNFIERL